MRDLPPDLDDFLSEGNACWRDFLPNPCGYYSKRVPKFAPSPKGATHGLGLCPFHGDDNADVMFIVDLHRGNWRCSKSCGCGDIVDFHMRMYGMNFDAAVRELILLREAKK